MLNAHYENLGVGIHLVSVFFVVFFWVFSFFSVVRFLDILEDFQLFKNIKTISIIFF